MNIRWQDGPVLQLDSDPFGAAGFAFGLLGLPGVILVGPSAHTLGDRHYECLLVHERHHWLQWMAAESAIWAVYGGLMFTGVLPWTWWALAALWLPQLLYLAIPPVRRWAESRAEEEQIHCLGSDR